MTLTTRIAALALALTSALSLTAATPADACGDYGSFRRAPLAKADAKKSPERIKGTVVAFRGMPAVTLGADARVTIQYPMFQNSGEMLYMTDVHVPASQLRPLHRALADALAKNQTARAGIELEQVGPEEWRLVSWRM